ncbi:MAG TPA: DUF488 domain-containing protein [Candidatus Bathyarchaeia archaeon]|nr:DUF488 domain-containing protein [Candidatus Bathyarchaeia archaeon]
MLKTKSLQQEKTKLDGLRICIMRRIRPEYDFDCWFPRVSPPEILLKKYIIRKEIKWPEFKLKFLRFLERHCKYTKALVRFAEERNITLLCWEKSPKKCHRKLVAEACRKINPKLKVVIK